MLHLFTLFFKMLVLGISAFYHDSAVALIDDGEIIAAAQKKDFQELNTMLVFQIGPR